MSRLAYQINVDAAQEKVWKILADFGRIYKYNPGVSSSHSTSSENGGVGASRHYDLSPAGSIEERIIEWNEGQSYSRGFNGSLGGQTLLTTRLSGAASWLEASCGEGRRGPIGQGAAI